MKIGEKTVVRLVYELVVDGQVADFCTEERPLEFIQGKGMLLPKFEENIAGLEPGEKFAFTLSPEEGYGVYDPERIISLPVAAFEIDGELRRDLMEVGTMLPLTDRAGNVVPGKVLEADELFVKIDVNSPMAGKTLNFSGHIVDVREASEKELAEGLERHGCGHCGGHCGDGGCERDTVERDTAVVKGTAAVRDTAERDTVERDTAVRVTAAESARRRTITS